MLFLRARVIPFGVSMCLVLVGEALQMGTILAWVLVASLGTWVSTRSMLVWRVRGAHQPSADEVEALRGALGRVPDLRGRLEPRVWVYPGARILMPSLGHLVVGQGIVDRQAEEGWADQVAAHAASAVARARILTRVWVVSVEMLCLPARAVLMPAARIFGSLPVLKWWMYAWLMILVPIATVQQAAAGRWPVGVGLIALAAATFVGPIWDKHWRRELDRIGGVTAASAGRYSLE